MTKEDYLASKEAIRKHTERLLADPVAARRHLERLGISRSAAPKVSSIEMNYPCTPQYIKVDLHVFLCD